MSNPMQGPDGAGRAPARWLPLLYFAFAYVSLAWAFATIAIHPHDVAGFFYQPRMLAVVHLVTLGWVSCSILGAFYVIAPMALRVGLSARRLDYWSFGCVALGVSGLVSHFWIDEVSGMAAAAALVTVGLTFAVVRFWRCLSRSPIPIEVKLHFRFALANLMLAAAMGLSLGLNKLVPFLPGYVLTNVYAHAHLAVLGWATMTVMGAGYRLLPMLLPSEMPRGKGVLASALLLQAGALGLFFGMLFQSRWAQLFGWLACAGIGAFVIRVRWMLSHRRAPPRALIRPDFGVWHALQALLYLVLAAVLGLFIAYAPSAGWKLQAAMAYGVFSLIGFLAQIVVGISLRLLPPFFWMWGLAGSAPGSPPPSPHVLVPRAAQAVGFALWSAGVPTLALGLTLGEPGLLRAAGAGLLTAVALGGVAHARALRRALAPR